MQKTNEGVHCNPPPHTEPPAQFMLKGKGSDTNVCHNQVTEPDSRDQDLSSRSSGRH